MVYSTSNRGLYVSRNDGNKWEQLLLPSPWQYTRSIVQSANRSPVMFVTNGEGSPGSDGRLFRSEDLGATWTDVKLPGEVESSIYFLATHPSDPSLVFAAAALGQLYRSVDGGDTWTAIRRRIGEIRALAWLPD